MLREINLPWRQLFQDGQPKNEDSSFLIKFSQTHSNYTCWITPRTQRIQISLNDLQSKSVSRRFQKHCSRKLKSSTERLLSTSRTLNKSNCRMEAAGSRGSSNIRFEHSKLKDVTIRYSWQRWKTFKNGCNIAAYEIKTRSLISWDWHGLKACSQGRLKIRKILGVRTYICFVLVLFRRDWSNKHRIYPAVRSQRGACMHLIQHMLLQGSQGLQHQTPWDWQGVRKQGGWGMTK